MKCRYEIFPGKEWCAEDAWGSSTYCVLHTDLPDDEASETFEELNQLKNAKVDERISKNNYNFSGSILQNVDFSQRKITRSLVFENATIKGDAKFDNADIESVWFDNIKIKGNAHFNKAIVSRGLRFRKAKIGGNFQFEKAESGGSISFEDAQIEGDLSLSYSIIKGDAWFKSAVIGGSLFCDAIKIVHDAFLYNVSIKKWLLFDAANIWGELVLQQAKIGADASFERAEIGEYVSLYMTEIGGEFKFKRTKFRSPESQEIACRAAKQICERLGDRGPADDYHFLEMQAKRKKSLKLLSMSFLGLARSLQADYDRVRYIRNPWKRRKRRVRFFIEDVCTLVSRFVKYLITFFVELSFGYGVKFPRLVATYIITVSLFGLYYSYNQVAAIDFGSLVNNILFSIFTITAPGYGISNIKPWMPEVSVAFEAVLGAFFWAALIAIFVRKYMK